MLRAAHMMSTIFMKIKNSKVEQLEIQFQCSEGSHFRTFLDSGSEDGGGNLMEYWIAL
jgi:hypothetical protein